MEFESEKKKNSLKNLKGKNSIKIAKLSWNRKVEEDKKRNKLNCQVDNVFYCTLKFTIILQPVTNTFKYG